MRRFTVIDCDQRTPAWLQARIGRVTSSSAAEMLAKGRGNEEAKGRRKLRMRLALERVTERSLEGDYVSHAMQAGIDREADAYAAYEAITGRMLERTGFCSDNILMAGCSLDGSVDDFTGIIEIKAPEWSAHWEAVKTSKVPTDYLKQVTHALFVTGAEWCDWMSYNPDFPAPLDVKLIRVMRDLVALEDYEDKLSVFLAEVAIEEEAIRTMTNLRGQLERSIA